ncbi:MAG: hypothetical protein L0Z62_45245 [Gemmataceae bacterium]|nr:hypothetical protein [Gemmataceae bacterium]
MRTRWLRRVALGLAAVLGLLSGGAAAEAQYSFTRIADSTGGGFTFGFGQQPAINNAGQVAFRGTPRTGGAAFGGAIFVGDGTRLVGIAGPGFHVLDSDPALNDHGTVVFHAHKTTTLRGVYAGNGSAAPIPVIESETFTGAYNNFGRQTRVNNSNVVAALGHVNGLAQSNGGIQVLSGNAVTGGASAAFTTSTSGQFFFLHEPSLNNTGTFAFAGTLTSSRATGIFTGTAGQPATPVAVTQFASNQFSGFSVNPPAINDAGAVAFIGSKFAPGSRSGVYRNDGGSTTTIADSNQGVYYQFDRVALNNAGQVAVQAILPNQVTRAIATGTSVLQEVIREGGTLHNRPSETSASPRTPSMMPARLRSTRTSRTAPRASSARTRRA